LLLQALQLQMSLEASQKQLAEERAQRAAEYDEHRMLVQGVSTHWGTE
jgi:hypothetical protein